MDLHLNGKIAFVTGASRGIGAATARLFAAEGADVVVAYGHDAEAAERTAGQVRALGRRAWTLGMDLADPEQVAAGVERAAGWAAPFGAVVLCAGYNEITPFEEVTPAAWDHILAVNLSGAFFLMQAVAPHLADGGAIVTVASVAAHTGAPHHAHYAAAKAGLVNLTKSAARALAPRIRVNCVAPGITLTEMGAETTAALPDDYAARKLLAGRFAEAEEIARWIVFAASPAAGFAHGATLDLNGGRVLR